MCKGFVQPRNWNGGGDDVDIKDLDYSGEGGSQKAASAAADPAKTLADRSLMEVKESVSFVDDDKALESQMAANSKNGAGAAAPQGVMGTFMASLQTRIVGKEALSAEDVQVCSRTLEQCAIRLNHHS